MNKKSYVFEKICIFFSFCLIFYGLYLYVGENHLIDPVKDVNVVSGEDKVVVTDKGKDNNLTTNGEVVGSNNSKPSEENNQTTTTPNPSTNNSGVSPPNTTPSLPPANPGNESNNNDNGSSSNPTPPVEITPTIEQTNDSIRKNLQNTYGITIKYGDEITGYNVGGMGTIGLEDAGDITLSLNNLKTNLEKYPSGFFKEFQKTGMNLSVYLIYSYSDDTVTGVTDSTYNNVVISIATKFSFSDSFNHEIYHYIEKFIEIRGGYFKSWELLNPADFTYGTVNSKLSYDKTFLADSYFVNNYAQTDADEDRASTFEYMMAEVECKCLESGSPIWRKAKTMVDAIDLFFTTVNSNTVEYWERFI